MIFDDMNKFSYLEELQNIIDKHQLVEIYRRNSTSFGVVQILHANDEFLTVVALSTNENTYEGVAIFPISDVESITIETAYLNTLSKQVATESIFQQAMDEIKDIENFTFNGFIAYLEKSKRFAEISIGDRGGEIVKLTGHDSLVLAIDEYSESSKDTIAHTYYKIEDLVGIALNTPRIKILERFLAM